MTTRKLFASILAACLLVIGFLDIAPAANAVPALQSLRTAHESASSGVIEITYRGRARRYYPPPIAPSYLYYDYPYYYSRGHYVTHIRPGFIYFGYPFPYYSRGYNQRYSSRRPKARRN